MKRAFDIVLSLTLLALLSPLLIGVWIAVRLDSSGPAVFRQRRVGLRCQEFEILKFRTMVQGADRSGGFRTVPGDSRVTRVGGFIRRYSVDELPQLVNVLLGDMSLVGPRPDVPAQMPDYKPEDRAKRHQVRPGITGLAQIGGRSNATPSQRLELDLRYVDTVSLWTDLKVLFATAFRITSKDTN